MILLLLLSPPPPPQGIITIRTGAAPVRLAWCGAHSGHWGGSEKETNSAGRCAETSRPTAQMTVLPVKTNRGLDSRPGVWSGSRFFLITTDTDWDGVGSGDSLAQAPALKPWPALTSGRRSPGTPWLLARPLCEPAGREPPLTGNA